MTQQLCGVRQQKRQKEQQLCDTRKQKEQTKQQLHDTNKQIEQQLCDMRQVMEELTKMKLKNTSLKHELNELPQKADVVEITRTANFIDYHQMDPSTSRNSSDGEEHQ